jgi:heat shock protein HslJ
MKRFKILILFFLPFLVYSCEKVTDTKQPSCFHIDLNDTTDYDIVNKWILLGFMENLLQNEDCKPENIKEMNIKFDNNNRFYANSSCNYLEGHYLTSEPDSIKIDSLMTTLIYCINDTVRDWEEKYMKGLNNATNFNIIGNSLKIKTKTDFDMIFRAE